MLLERPSCRTIEQLASDIRSVEQQQQANRVRENDLPPKYEDLVGDQQQQYPTATVTAEEEDSPPPMYTETMATTMTAADGGTRQKWWWTDWHGTARHGTARPVGRRKFEDLWEALWLNVAVGSQFVYLFVENLGKLIEICLHACNTVMEGENFLREL